MTNPFKFGTLVSDDYFTDRQEESIRLSQIMDSENHLIMIAPRRYGKTSLVHKVLKTTQRPVLWLDLQLLTGVTDFASQLLKQVFKKYPFEKIKYLVRNFRIVPNLSIDPQSNNIEIKFQPTMDNFVQLEDVLNLIENLGGENKIVVVFDEFQEVMNLGKNLDRKLRATIQLHKNINYVFLGSVESMMKDIFEKKKSPFYHFGVLFSLNKIPYSDFKSFLRAGFATLTDKDELISEQILAFSLCHPYYTQQLAFHVWMKLEREKYSESIINETITDTIHLHDNDFERMWNNMNNTDKKILIGLSVDAQSPLKEQFATKNDLKATSTVFSGLKRLSKSGIIYKSDVYEFDDPFFKQWLLSKREDE
jgi:uncharacterized protein